MTEPKPRSEAWKRSPEFLGWLREPSAERFVCDLQQQVDDSLHLLLSAAAISEDPKVRERHATWKKLDELTQWLRGSRRDSAVDDE